jgi:hypothetical protein
MKKWILIFTLTVLLTSCDYFDGITIQNDSQRDILVSAELRYKQHPDTFTIPNYNMKHIKPGAYGYVGRRTTMYDQDLYSILETDVISIYIISPDTLDKYGFEEVQNSYNILARYDITKHIHKHFYSHFEYPPSQQMINSGMKIYANPNNPDL